MGSEMCIRDRYAEARWQSTPQRADKRTNGRERLPPPYSQLCFLAPSLRIFTLYLIMALMLSRFYGWERTCSADIHLPKNSRGRSLCLLADSSVYFYSSYRKIFYLASPDLFFFFAGCFCCASFFWLFFCSFCSCGGIFITWSSPLNRVKISGD